MKTTQYKVTFPNNPEYNADYELSLEKSGSFQYGNGTCVEVRCNGKHDEAIDTRYENMTDFETWCDEYMSHKFDPSLLPQIERVRP